jgi:hypothetical protein
MSTLLIIWLLISLPASIMAGAFIAAGSRVADDRL